MGEITRGILLVKIVQIFGLRVFQFNIDESKLIILIVPLFVEVIVALAVEIMIHLVGVFDVWIYQLSVVNYIREEENYKYKSCIFKVKKVYDENIETLLSIATTDQNVPLIFWYLHLGMLEISLETFEKLIKKDYKTNKEHWNNMVPRIFEISKLISKSCILHTPSCQVVRMLLTKWISIVHTIAMKSRNS